MRQPQTYVAAGICNKFFVVFCFLSMAGHRPSLDFKRRRLEMDKREAAVAGAQRRVELALATFSRGGSFWLEVLLQHGLSHVVERGDVVLHVLRTNEMERFKQLADADDPRTWLLSDLLRSDEIEVLKRAIATAARNRPRR